MKKRTLFFALALVCGLGLAASAKALIREVWGRPAEEAQSMTARALARRRVSAEGQDGLKAFLEKRKPGWIE